MGSATRSATIAVHAALAKSLPASLTTAEALFGASAVIASSTQLRSTLSDPAIDAGEKQKLVTDLFGKSFDKAALALVVSATAQRWSTLNDLVAGIEDLALRAAASSVTGPGEIESELFSFARAVSSNAELELALGSKLGNPEAKATLARTLLTKAKALPATVVVVSSLVQNPRGRRIGALLSSAAATIANQGGYLVATVTSAQPLDPAQLTAVSSSVAMLYGRKAVLDLHVDARALGGVRIQVGDDVIDGSIATLLDDLRSQLAG
ncbi:MAG: F0F1 ATP synthase subunit delta [Actinobacteria bacterium]|nr:F0F1 ATP synthase subunit delta [Actinomycetota bacterium]